MAFPTWLLSHHLTLPLLHTVFASTVSLPLCLSQQLLLGSTFGWPVFSEGPGVCDSLPHSAYLLQGRAVSKLNQYLRIHGQRPEMDSGRSYMHLNPVQCYSEDSVLTTAGKIKPSLALRAAASSELRPVRGKG